LFDRIFSFVGFLGIAVKVLGADDFGGQLGPKLGNLDVVLPKDDLPFVVGDLGRAGLPLDFVERMDLRVAEDPLDGKSGTCPLPTTG